MAVEAKIVVTLVALTLLATLLMGCQESSSFMSPVSTSPLPSIVATDLSRPTPTAQPLVFPTSRPGFATLTGIALRADTRTSIQNDLFLGEVIETTDPNRPIVGLDTTEAPKAILDPNTGAFVFYDVPPGRYALVIWQPLGAPILVEDKVAGGTLLLTLEPDDNITLGTIEAAIP